MSKGVRTVTWRGWFAVDMVNGVPTPQTLRSNVRVEAPAHGAPAQRVSNHAFERYLERWIGIGRNGAADIDKAHRDEIEAHRTELCRLISTATLVGKESGSSQYIWRTSNGMLFVVLDDLVKTVLPKDTKRTS